MNYSTNAGALRDRGMEYLRKGKEMYNTKESFEEKERGFKIFRQGLQFIVDYLKIETNLEFKAKTKENLKIWLDDCEVMSQNIKASSMKPVQIQQTFVSTPAMNGNNTSPNIKQENNQNKPLTKTVQPYTKKTPEDTKNQNEDMDISKKKERVKDNDDKKIESSISEAIVTEKPNVQWSDVCGLEAAKKALQEAVILPIKFPQLFVGSRKPWKGILLYGPPGTGKTFLAKACATEADATFFSISSSDLISKWVGDSEKLIKKLFNMAREKKPAIIFIDEIDSLLSARSDNENEATRRVKTEFLVQMQGVGHDDTGILVLGATNIPWGLDSAVRRRFERRIYIPLPEQVTRLQLAQKLMAKTPNNLDEEDYHVIAERTAGYSGSDMSTLVRDACYEPLRRCREAEYFKEINGMFEPCPPSDPKAKKMDMMSLNGEQLKLPLVTIEDFYAVLSKSKKSVSEEDLKQHEIFTKNFGQEG